MKLLITVKTYPSFSAKHDEVVCTAGITEKGEWIRLYPIKFRELDYGSQYRKYDWIEVDAVRFAEDFRSETYTPIGEISRLGHVGPEECWRERRKVVGRCRVYTNIDALVKEAKNKPGYTSLAVFKPTKVSGFCCHKAPGEWDKEKLRVLNQLRIFEPHHRKLEPVRKLPYTFTYRFEDDEGTEHNSMVADWELGALYWNCLEKHRGNEKSACADVKRKYFDDFAKTKDLHFFMGTVKLHHLRAENPFIIIGTYHPKKCHQTELCV